ncbi:D-alanyl-D-alanine carboxypeptidase/D-alanyl-D-alanine endopeptidase [Actinopolyspora saharensis]|uniref:D-alanyl-D-alanine carboxypeptidase/D-alanyl-D-alanine endopeptidase n=1 Tax=Actinopolyspora saharensis TaxID=995062 RepID=UPI003F66F0A9
MSDPQASKGETGDHEEVDSSAATAAESSPSAEEHDITGTSEDQGSLDWPAEDPEATSGEAAASGAAESESSEGSTDSEGSENSEDSEAAAPAWPEHDESAVESTQRLETIGHAEGASSEETSPEETSPAGTSSEETPAEESPPAEPGPGDSGSAGPADDPPTVQLAVIPPTVVEKPPSDGQRSPGTSDVAGSGSPGASRPADPADFGMPPGGATSGVPRLLGSPGARALPESEPATGGSVDGGDGGEGVVAGTSAVGSGAESSAETAPVGGGDTAAARDDLATGGEGTATGGGEVAGGGERNPDAEVSRGDPPDTVGAAGGSGSGGGARRFHWKRVRERMGRRSAITAVSLAGVIVLGLVAVLGTTTWFGDVLNPRADPPAPVRLDPAVSGLDSSARMPTRQGLSRALEGVVADPALSDLGGTVLDSRTGKVLWSRNADRGMVPASTNKLLTSCAALLAVDHDFRFSTKVVRGQDPGSVVLVGGGDPTLSALPEGRSSVYPDAARLDELVRKIRSSTSGEIDSVKVDVSRYSGPTLAEDWDQGDVRNGYIAPVRPVMLDGGREDPTDIHSPRSEHPALDAARELASRLGASTESVSTTTVRGSTSTLAEVRSPPLRDLVRKLLRDSDNVLAEAVARQVAVATGHEPSFSGAVRAVRSVLERNGFDLSGVELVDGSGLADADRLPPRLLGELLRTASAPADGPSGRSARLRPVLTAVPIAGATGSLAGRYDGPASEARGWVRAKTGTLTGANALAGTVVTKDGRLLSFAFVSNGSQPNAARPALDRVAAKLRSCGCR